MKKNTTIAIVNFNCGEDTEHLLNDLFKQTNKNFDLWLFDQGSTEQKSIELLDKFKNHSLISKIVQNNFNKPLNHIWNETCAEATTELVTLLNNDIRITNNYIAHTISAFEKNKNLKMAIHPTNNKYFMKATALNIKLLQGLQIKHGWEMTVNREWFNSSPIPTELKFYCGDDWIFERLYNGGEKIAYVLSAPIIHNTSKTINHNYNNELINGSHLLKSDVDVYINKMHKKIFLKAHDDFSNIFKEKNINYILKDL